MKRFGTSVTAIILSLVMIFVLVPVQAFASVLENSSEYNEEVLEAIKNVVGSEDEAELYYDLMEHYGLLDETGNMAESWSIRMDSRDITLAELKEVLAGDYDPDKYIIVDETPVTLGDVATMIEIEEYVAYIRDTYFIDGEWTQAQKDSYDSLVEQVQTRGIRFTNPGSGSASGSTVSQEGLDQGARITFTRTGDLEFRADLIGAAPGQEAVFEYSFVPVTCERSDGEGGYFVITKTMQAGGDGTASVSVDPDLPDGVTYRALDKDAQGSYLMLSIRAVKNCLFINEDGQDCDAMYIPVFIENSSELPFNTIGTVRIPAWQGVSVTQSLFLGWELPCSGSLSDVQKDLDKVLRAIEHGYYSSFKLELTARVEIEDQYYMQGELPVATGGTIKRNTEQDSKEGNDYYHTTTLSWNQSQYVTDIGIPIGEGNGTFKYKGKQGGRHIYELTFTTDPEHAAYWAQWFNKDHPSERELLSYRHTLSVEDAAVVYGNKTYSWELSGATVVIYDDTAPHTVSVWKASGEYLPGMGIPLYVQFSEAVQAESTTITLNGRTIPALAGTGLSDKQVFIYPVGELDATTLRMTGYYTKDAFGNIGDPSGSNYSVVIDGVSMKTPVKTHTFTGIGASVNSVIQNVYTIDVFADISKDPGMTAWLISELEEDPESSKARYKGLFYTLYIPGLTDPDDPDTLLYNGDIHTIWDLEGGLEGTVTGGRFCSQVQLDLRRYFSDHTEPLECVFALYSGELDQNNVAHVEPIFGKTCSLTINPPKLVTQNDMKIRLTVDYPDPDLNDIDMTFPREGETDMYRLSVNLAGEPTIRAQVVLNGNDFTFGDTTHTTIYDPAYTNGRTMDASAHFLWALDGAGRDASDYARIDKDGYIYPTGMPGNFYVIACAMGGYAGSVPSTFGNFILEFDEGYSPYLSIPNAAKEIDVISGAPANIYWSSNIVRKNGYNPTTFRVTVRVAQSENLPMDGLIYETYVTGDIGAPVSGVSIPGNYLNYQYYNATYNNFIVTVSTTYDGTEYSASVPLNVLSLPANVEFHNIGSLYVVDTVGSTDINWTITNFEQYSSGENLFEMRIARSGGRDETVITDPGQDDGYGTYAGSYTLQIPDVMADPSDPSSYRDVYVVTIKAKNGTDSTWSYDSFMLYVYDRDALDILVDGEHVGDSFTMSNRSSISQMTSEQILALKRDISLHNVISANYGEYAWAELADKMEWESSDNSVATINYQQGGVYDDIRNYNYTSYRPSADFVLSGLGDGTSDITVTHVRTGMTDTLTVNVETLRNRLYLFQFYPKVRTQVKYTDGTGAVKTVYTDSDGALALYEESGIKGMISCSSAVTDGEEEKVYFGTFKSDNLLSGEADPTKLELYPCNRLELRQAAYAYIYIKNPDGTPYTGDISMRGGVYVDDVYQSGAKFSFNSSDIPSLSGDEDRVVALGENGRLTILMDRMQWAAGDALDTASRIRYVFLIRPYPDNAQVYPMFVNMDASLNMKAFISSGQSIVNFRANGSGSRHPFIIEQYAEAGGIRKDVLHTNSRIGISDTAPSCTLTSVALWWGEAAGDASENTLQLYSADGRKLAVGENDHTTYSTSEVYPFIEEEMTTYTVTLSQDNLAQTIPSGTKQNAYIEFSRDGAALSRRENLRLWIVNLKNVGEVVGSQALASQLAGMGKAATTSGSNSMSSKDEFVNTVLKLVSNDKFTKGTEKLFGVKIVPTTDPTRFIGFMEVSAGGRIEGAGDTGFSFMDTDELEYGQKLALMQRLEMASMSASDWSTMKKEEMRAAKYNEVGPDYDKGISLGGYMEVIIYYDFNDKEWRMQPLSGGFYAGAHLEYQRSWNYMAGPVPFTVELTAGGQVEVSMDAVTAVYIHDAVNTDHVDTAAEYLTQLRLYLYLKLFAGVGIDYSVIAFKLGVFGMISLDLQFAWLNRPYLESSPNAYLTATGLDANQQPNPPQKNNEPANLSGQHLRLNGQIGIELVIKLLFFELDWVLLSYSFDMANVSFNSYDSIQTHWENNQKNLQRALEVLMNNGDVSMMNAGGSRMAAVSLAPVMETRDYLKNGEREWGYTPRRGPANPINNLESNTYPYADPELTRDGEILVFLTDQQSAGVTDTRAAFATSGWPTYQPGGIIDDGGFGDSQLAVDGTGDFAMAAWTRQMVDLKKEAGEVLTDDDQVLMMNGTEVYAAVYTDGRWDAVQLTDNTDADLAPTVAAFGRRAVVAWRSVVSGGIDRLADFNDKDTILYKVYEGGRWSDTMTLYNGTSGAVKAITSAMMEDGTAAVAYTLDKDKDDSTVTDREIVYAVIGRDNEVIRNVQATNDEKLDENPQIAAVTFPQDGREHFLLGWYTQKMNTDTAGSSSEKSDIGLMDFDAQGITGQLIPEYMSKVATAPDVSVTSDFRFTKNAGSITDLSLIWVERDVSMVDTQSGTGSGESENNTDLSAAGTEKDVMKGIRFYLYGEGGKLIGLTDALRVAEMPDATLIDHFDAFTMGGNQVKAVVLGTTYGKNGEVETRTAQTASGLTIDYTVPKATYAMYTAVDSYSNSFDVKNIAVDYDAIRLGADTLVGVTVHNGGTEPINSISVDIGSDTTAFGNIELLPGHTMDLWADYSVPADSVEDPSYNVSVNFEDSGVIELPEAGTVSMDLPDLQITKTAILEEAGGLRTIQVKLNNRQDSALAGSGRKVRLSFFKDATFESPIDDEYLIGVNGDIIISSDADLKLIDDGGFSYQAVFDVAGFLKAGGDEVVEITDGGVPVYIKAEVLQTVEGVDRIVPEPVESNNYSHVTCENLRLRTGSDVIISSDFAVEGNTTTVTAHLQNTRLTETTTGNLIVSLLDADGRLIEQKQSYDESLENNGLITLGAEAVKDVTVTFDHAGSNVAISYTDKQIEQNNAELGELTVSGVSGITMDMFTDDGSGTLAAEISTDDMDGSFRVTAAAVSTLSKVSISTMTGSASSSGGGLTFEASATSPAVPGQDTVITVHVENSTMETGPDETDYVLTIHNSGAPVIGKPSFTLTDPTTAVITIDAQPQPAGSGLQLGYHWYECDADGNNRTEIQNCTGAETAELTVTDSFGTEARFYVCEVIREYADGSLSDGLYFSEPCGIFIGNVVILRTRDLTITYGDTDPFNSYMPISNDQLYDLEGEGADRVNNCFLTTSLGSLSFSRESGTDAGTYAITPVMNSNYWVDENYDVYSTGETYFVVTIPGMLTILPAEVTVQADTKTKYAGEQDPEFTVSIMGVQNYEDPGSVISYQTPVRETGEDIGDYTITVTGEAVQGNYNVTFVNGTLTIAEPHLHDGIIFEPWPYSESLPDGGNWYLTRDVTLSRPWYLGNDTNLCLNGHSMIGKTENGNNERSIVEIFGPAALSIYDDVGTGFITGINPNYTGTEVVTTIDPDYQIFAIVTLNDGSVLNLYGGTIRGRSGFDAPRDAIVYIKDAVFNMYGGCVSGAEGSSSCGIRVGRVDYSSMNTHEYGELNMYGGIVENNHISWDVECYGGGGVYVDEGSTFSMYGGIIRNNSVYFGNESDMSCDAVGGGVYNAGTFDLHDGTISNNAVSSSNGLALGGGVYNAGAMTIYGGRITGNAGGDIGIYSDSENVLSIACLPEESCSIAMDIYDSDTGEYAYSSGVFTDGLSAAGSPEGVFSSFRNDYEVVMTASGEAQLVPRSLVSYAVTFEVDGSAVAQINTAKGDVPVYLGAAPTKAETDDKIYVFTGWSPELAPATSDAVYTAVFREITKPAFKTQSLLLSGRIGVNFYMDLSGLTDEQKAASYVEFTVSGINGGTQTVPYDAGQMNREKTYYGFTCRINAVQMADTITAVFHYTDVYGVPQTVTKTYTVETYLNAFTEADGEETYALIKAINDYGYYAQQFLSQNAKVPWTLGTDHAAMAKVNALSYSYTADDLSQYAIQRTLNSDVASVSYSLSLDADTAINLYVTPAEGYQEAITAQLGDGTPLTVTPSGSRYKVTITGVSAHLLGEMYDVRIITQSGASSVRVSALSYAYASMDDSDPGRYVMSAIYDYYLRSIAYKNYLDQLGH